MSSLFIWAGVTKVFFAGAMVTGFARMGLPLPPVVLALSLVVEIGGGIAVLVGWQTRWAALALAAWCVATALVAHYHPGDRGQMIHFIKNLSIAGGFLQLVAFGPGRLSIDQR